MASKQAEAFAEKWVRESESSSWIETPASWRVVKAFGETIAVEPERERAKLNLIIGRARKAVAEAFDAEVAIYREITEKAKRELEEIRALVAQTEGGK